MFIVVLTNIFIKRLCLYFNTSNQHNFSSYMCRYLKGHLSIDQLNLGVSEINVILAKKYEYLDVPKGSLSVGDRKIRGDYRKEIVDMQSKQ